MIRNIYKKNLQISSSREKTIRSFPTKIMNKARIVPPATDFSIILETLANVIGQEKEIKRPHIGKEEIKMFLPASDTKKILMSWSKSHIKLHCV